MYVLGCELLVVVMSEVYIVLVDEFVVLFFGVDGK